ncbi:hypothetical protein ODJ79_09680 [Actinoplanes sp. KI2]|uniref:hypothetical protein n=1 Tax=Actinoplanes sp. KI2 TaxID=2983315 RepID=UPI0021D5D75D|nr:hypothetical protein [Actinoplanes sp. KI2]MCU7723985.1 hypothetical protein [Actinoplanes sp. KI2]
MTTEPSSVEALVLRRALEGSVLPRLQAGASPQRLLTTLLAEHWLDAPAALPMSALMSSRWCSRRPPTSAGGSGTAISRRTAG